MNEVRFNRKTIASEAISGDSGTIYFTPDTHRIIMGGNIYGQEIPGEQTEFLEELWGEHQKDLWVPKLTVSHSIVSPGQEITVTIRSEFSGILAPLDTLPKPAFGYIYGQKFKESYAKPGVYTTTFSVGSEVGTLKSLVEVTYDGETRPLISTLPCHRGVVWGWSDQEVLQDVSFLKGWQIGNPVSAVSGAYQFSSTGIGYYYLLVPTGTSSPDQPKVTEDFIPVYFVKQESGPLGYTTYRIADLQAPGNHTFIWH